jgi:hypothetical protein
MSRALVELLVHGFLLFGFGTLYQGQKLGRHNVDALKTRCLQDRRRLQPAKPGVSAWGIDCSPCLAKRVGGQALCADENDRGFGPDAQGLTPGLVPERVANSGQRCGSAWPGVLTQGR